MACFEVLDGVDGGFADGGAGGGVKDGPAVWPASGVIEASRAS